MNAESNLFGEELRRLRKDSKNRYTQSQLAQYAGISAGYISLLESGKKKPTKKVIEKLHGPLEVSENHLLKLIGIVKMDFAATMAINRQDVPKIIDTLRDGEFTELMNFLNYIKAIKD